VLFIGGTGTISSAASDLAVERGLDVTLLNRGASSRAPHPDAEFVLADVNDPDAVDAAIGSREFDVVVDMIAFTPEHVERDMDRFAGRTGQYVFISSASAYAKPVAHLPITESTPLKNPYWQYSRDKIACESLLNDAWRERDFPATIVRPSHTYDEQSNPLLGGWANIERMRAGEKVVVPGDGTSLWTLTHADDFAVGFVGLFGNSLAIGDTFQITSDFVYTWDEIYRIMANAAGTTADIRHVTSDDIEASSPIVGGQVLGDRAHSVVFDNSKIRGLVPEFAPVVTFHEGAREIIEWHDADESRQASDPRWLELFARLAG
jgi:nucleoside-diphosphate-sugar epimerase